MKNQNFKRNQDYQFAMGKFVLNEKGEVYQVQCKICTFVKGKQQKKPPKLDNLLKHQSHRKAKVSMPNVDTYTFYSNKNSMHVQSEHN